MQKQPLPIMITMLAAAVLTGPALAQPAAPSDADEPRQADRRQPQEPADLSDLTVRQLVDRLDAADYQQREAAKTELMVRQGVADDRLAEALSQSDSPERRHRLRDILMHRFFRRLNPTDVPRDQGNGALGVTFRRVPFRESDGEGQHQVMLVTRPHPGFPAYAKLKAGDLILGVGDHRFTNAVDNIDFQDAITRYDAGETITFTVLRDGREMRIPVTLDSYRRLEEVKQRADDFTDPPNPALYPRWLQHYRSLVGEVDEAPLVHLSPPEDESSADARQNGGETGG